MAGSNVTTASFALRLTSARLTPFSPSRAFLTATGQAPQVIPSTVRTTVELAANTAWAKALRVEIQSSRFLIADLSHRNAGAYWEAGYAEGLGKPVIFTCSEAKFAEASHFDTNHHFHVLWDETNPEAATKKLKASIRATIPEATHE